MQFLIECVNEFRLLIKAVIIVSEKNHYNSLNKLNKRVFVKLSYLFNIGKMALINL